MLKFWKADKPERSKRASEEQARELTRADALACVPVPNPDVETIPFSDTAVRLSCPMVYAPWMQSVNRFLKRNPAVQMKTLELDELGTACWKLLDGTRTVSQVITAFASQYKLHPQEAHVAVTTFLRDLGKRGLVVMQCPEPR